MYYYALSALIALWFFFTYLDFEYGQLKHVGDRRRKYAAKAALFAIFAVFTCLAGLAPLAYFTLEHRSPLGGHILAVIAFAAVYVAESLSFSSFHKRFWSMSYEDTCRVASDATDVDRD